MKLYFIAICIFEYDGKILVERVSQVSGKYFYRPPGVEVSTEEIHSTTLMRYVKDVYGASIEKLDYTGQIENRSGITFFGDSGSEVVSIYFGIFDDPELIKKDVIKGIGPFSDVEAFWKTLDEIEVDGFLFPDGLAEYLKNL